MLINKTLDSNIPTCQNAFFTNQDKPDASTLTVKALVALHGCRFELHVKPKEGLSSEMLRSSCVLDNQSREHWSCFWGIKWNFFLKHFVVIFPLMWHMFINLQSWQGALSTCTPACRYTDDLHEDDPLIESQRGFFSVSPLPEALYLTWGQHLRWIIPCCFSSALLSGSGWSGPERCSPVRCGARTWAWWGEIGQLTARWSSTSTWCFYTKRCPNLKAETLTFQTEQELLTQLQVLWTKDEVWHQFNSLSLKSLPKKLNVLVLLHLYLVLFCSK